MAATGYEVALGFPPPYPRTIGTLLGAAFPLPQEISVRNGVDRAWLGVKFHPWGCGPLSGFNALDCTPDDLSTYGVIPGEVVQPAFSVYDALKCSTLSQPAGELARRMAGRWQQWLSASFARELMTAAVSGGHGFQGDASIINPGVPHSVVEAVGELENALAQTIGNSVGAIHVPPRFISRLVGEGGVQGDATSGYLTASGHRVIFDAGYASEFVPEGASNSPYTMWMYASGPVFYGATQPQLITINAHESIDFSRNIEHRFEEAKGILVYDPCSVFAIEVDVWGAVGS